MYSLLSSIFIVLVLIHKSTNLPIETSPIFSNNNYESSPLPKLPNSLSSSTINDQAIIDVKPEKPEISETVSKILRLMHSLSNKSILIPSKPDEANNPNYNLELIKNDNLKNFDFKDRSSLNLKLIIENDKLNEKLKKLNKINQQLNENLNQKLQNERFNNDFNNDDLFEKLREFNKKEEYSSSNAKYLPEDDEASQLNNFKNFNRFNQEQPKTDFIAPVSKKFDELLNKENEEIKNPTYIKLLSKLNEQIEEEQRESNKLITKNQFNNVESKEQINNMDLKDELNRLEDQKKNLYDLVENEEEDNLAEEDLKHSYDITLLSDNELNRTLMDIQYLLNNNLSKQEMETKFSSKGRNNRNKIAQRMEYFEQLYRNIHNLSLPQNQKRGEGPQLSVVSPLDILRDKLVLEQARRKIERSKSQMKENEKFLKEIG